MNDKGEKPTPGFSFDELQNLLFPDISDEDDLMTVAEIVELMKKHMPQITSPMIDYRLGQALKAGKVERKRVRRIIGGQQRYAFGYRKVGGGKIVDDA